MFYLNTFGSLYSINSKGKINWFLNINQYSEVDASNSFGSNPLTLYKNKAFQNFTYWSQHLFLFNTKTMAELIEQTGLKLNWIKHIQRYPLSNHLYWLSKGNPGGQKDWSFLDNDKLAVEYEKQLASIGKTDTLVASLSL